jgi:hypothetical protein
MHLRNSLVTLECTKRTPHSGSKKLYNETLVNISEKLTRMMEKMEIKTKKFPRVL